MKYISQVMVIVLSLWTVEPHLAQAMALTKSSPAVKEVPLFALSFEEKKLLTEVVVIPLISAAVVLTTWYLYTEYASGKKDSIRVYKAEEITTRFTDVAGAHEAKKKCKTIVDYLRHPEKYHKMEAKLPRGVLLTGDPGNGKTFLARALAGEAGCSFFAMSGSSFIQEYIGTGPARVRELFKNAREHTPCIIFIDEIDSIGQRRSSSGNYREHNATLNELLVSMDGFDSDDYAIVVVGATNRPDILDAALTRSNRLGKGIVIPSPDKDARLELLKLHVRKKVFAHDINLEELAEITHGLSAVDITELINNAKIQAAQDEQEIITQQNLHDAYWAMAEERERIRKLKAAQKASHSLHLAH